MEESVVEGGAEELFADFLARAERGEGVRLDELCRNHPAHARELRALGALWGKLEGVSVEEERHDEAHAAQAASKRSDPSTLEPRTSGSGALMERLRGRAPRATRYRILGELARGGMGVILQAWDDELRRTLAMKVMLGRESGSGEASPRVDPQMLGRFLEEAQVTGQLDHPGIVPVHELGVDADGRAYFTMRWVKGEELRAIFDHVKAGRDGWSQVRVLGVLLKACEALSYAHAKGVIHRDLKPSNIMVGRFGEVYVMDWGLARVQGREDRHDLRFASQSDSGEVVVTDRKVEQELTPDSPLLTMDGTVVGTPCYMSPEQARGERECLGPHSDVFSVGAMLYQLVTGTIPYVPEGARIPRHALLAAVLRGPPRPIEELAPRTSPELVSIIDKAMARTIGERYATTTELAEDLRAYLEGRVVGAHEAGAWAEARKWVSRNRALAGAMAAVLLAVVAGVLVSLSEARRANANARESERHAAESDANERRALEVARFVQEALVGSDASRGGSQDYSVVEAMRSALAELERGGLADDPRTEAALEETISSILDGNGRPEEALAVAERALATRRRLFSGAHPELAESLTARANALESLGRSAEALEEYEAVLAMRLELATGDDAAVASAMNNVASCLQSLGRITEALPLYLEALEMRERLFGNDHADVATSLSNLASVQSALGRDEESIELHRSALEIRRRRLGEDRAETVASRNNLAYCLVRLGRSEEALPLYEQTLEAYRRIYTDDHPTLAISIGNLAYCLYKVGRYEESLAREREAFEMRQRLFQGDHPDLAMSLTNLGSRLFELGRPEEALPALEGALEMSQRLYEGDHPDLVVQLDNYARCLQALGRPEDALPYLLDAHAMGERVFDGDHPSMAIVLDGLASCLLDLGNGDEALEQYRTALDMRRRLYSDDHPDLVTAWNNYGFALNRLGRGEEAVAAYRESLMLAERLYPGDHPLVAGQLANTADAMIDIGRLDEAEELVERLEQMRSRLPGLRYPSAEQIAGLRTRIRSARPR